MLIDLGAKTMVFSNISSRKKNMSCIQYLTILSDMWWYILIYYCNNLQYMQYQFICRYWWEVRTSASSVPNRIKTYSKTPSHSTKHPRKCVRSMAVVPRPQLVVPDGETLGTIKVSPCSRWRTPWAMVCCHVFFGPRLLDMSCFSH